MTENPRITIASETVRHLRNGDFEAATAVLRHEGLKKGVETSLYWAGRSELGRLVLNKIAGEPIDDPLLRTNVADLELDGPVGIAPGWDKTGKTIQSWQAVGARHITIGGITFFPQAGNRMPRLHTMEQNIGDHGKAISLNSFGFWSPGVDKVVYNIQKQKELGKVRVPIIAQLTINKEFYEADNLDLVHELARMTVRKILPVADAISLGLTSPNTKGMRQAQDAGDQFMLRVVSAARTEIDRSDRRVPLIYKGDADGREERLEYYCKWAQYREGLIDAFELINTTALPHIKTRYNAASLPGGLAGADQEYQQMALDAVRFVYEAVGDKVDIIYTGGANSGDQVLLGLENGGSAAGVNTAIRTFGIAAPRLFERRILQLIKQKYPDATSLGHIIGAATQRGPKVQHQSRI